MVSEEAIYVSKPQKVQLEKNIMSMVYFKKTSIFNLQAP